MLNPVCRDAGQNVFSTLLFVVGLLVVKNISASDLTIEISNFKHNNGQVVVSLFDDADAFPTKPEKAVKTVRGKIANLAATVSFVGVAPGIYAVSVYHDENDNNKLDSNFIGVPKEPVAVSMNARGSFGPPKFGDAKFKIDGNNQIIQIRMAKE